VGLHSLVRPSMSVRIGTSGEALNPFADGDVESEQFTVLSAVPQDLAKKYKCVKQIKSRLLAQKAQRLNHGVSSKDPMEPILRTNPKPALKVPRAWSSPQQRLGVLTVQTLSDGLRVHLQCNGRCGAQRQNLRLCSSGDVEGLGMFGNPATWTLHTVGEHNGCPMVTLHVELQGARHYLRLDKQGQRIDGRGQGGVDCHLMVKTKQLDSGIRLHPVVSPLARLGVQADGTMLDVFAAESDLQCSFSLLLSCHSDTPDWQVVDESKIRPGSGDGPVKVVAELLREWSVLESKEWQSGDDW